jgi:hypothetical protein
MPPKKRAAEEDANDDAKQSKPDAAESVDSSLPFAGFSFVITGDSPNTYTTHRSFFKLK